WMRLWHKPTWSWRWFRRAKWLPTRKPELRLKGRQLIRFVSYMKGARISVALLCFFSVVIAGKQTRAQQGTSEVARGYDLSRLDLSPEKHNQLKGALQRKDYQEAERILVEEAERDPTSPRAARLFEFSGGLFFLDGQYVNSVIAWKK